jgi:hypothetical protein
MKHRIILFVIFALLFCLSYGQEKAVTERGDTVILYSNGSWDYYENYITGEERVVEIPWNEITYTKPETSSKKIPGNDDYYEIWYDHKIWKRIPPGELNEDAEIALQMINGDAYAMLIYEKIQIPIERLSDIALENALNAAPDINLASREYRIVNNDTMVCMQMNGTTSGMKISYYSYYYSDKDGSIQFHTFTGQNLLAEYKPVLNDLLNGLIILRKD